MRFRDSLSHIPQRLTVSVQGHLNRICNPDLHKKDWWSTVGSTTGRDAHPVEGGAVSSAESVQYAALFAASAEMVHLIARLVDVCCLSTEDDRQARAILASIETPNVKEFAQ